jgi:hypothetical protein
MSRAFHDCTAECDFKHLMFLFAYRDENLDKNWVLGSRFFTGFSRWLPAVETADWLGFWSGPKIFGCDRPRQLSPLGDKNELK